MRRVATAGLMALLIWALVPAVGEIVENAVHFVQEGHGAHEAPDGDHHDPADAEHGCSDVVHLCSCCVSLSVVPTQLAGIIPGDDLECPVALPSANAPAYGGHGIYHPPRA